MDISKTNTQVNILFENEEDIDALFEMCECTIDWGYTDNARDLATRISEVVGTEDAEDELAR